jgi:uncharacterized phage protein (TIGR02220 family)
LFAGLWTLSDRRGRLEDEPKEIKAQLLPFYDVDANCLLEVLRESKFIHRYESDGNKYIQIINFEKHQNPHIKEPESTIPAPDLSGSKTVITGSGPADSLLPLTDSLNPITTLSGKQPDVIQIEQRNFKKEAQEILDFLNSKTGRQYRPVDANIKPIIARLKTCSQQDVRTMIVRKFREWHANEKMEKYLRPKTLFSASNFENYIGECVDK